MAYRVEVGRGLHVIPVLLGHDINDLLLLALLALCEALRGGETR